MTLEGTLSGMGNNPISDLPNYRSVIAFINGNLKQLNNAKVTGDTPSDEVLEQIYSLENVDTQTKLLERPVMEINKDNRFKNVLLGTALALTAVIVAIVLVSIFSTAPLPPETVGLLKDIVAGVFELAKTLLTGG